MNKIITKIMGMTVLMLCMAACSDNFDLPDIDNQDQTSMANMSPFMQKLEEPSTIEQFRRTYGVGFSYDVVHGEKCNMKDIRCQVFDLAKVRELEQSSSQGLIRISYDNKTTIDSYSTFNLSEYEQSVNFNADVNANLILVHGKGSGTFSIWEGGEVNHFYCVTRITSPILSVTIDGKSMAAFIKRGHSEILSKNFLEACKWMEKHTDDLVVDSFINRYGTHVVTNAVMGGRLDIEMKMQLDSLLDVTDTKLLGELSADEILKMKGSSEAYSKELNLMNNADCHITIRGGDLSLIPGNLLHFTFGQRPDINAYAQQWMASINYDPEDWDKSNLEMADMQTQPIWEFIPNKDVADRVKQRIMSTAVELIRQLGYQNGVCTAIDMKDEVKCNILNKQVSFWQPRTTNVIAAGRFVATICRERISDIDASKDVKVVYPIYDRQVNLSSGFCIANGHAYRVRNLRNGYDVQDLGETDETTVYLNCGAPGTAHYDNIEYLHSHNVAGVEIPYSINKEGQADTSRPYYLVVKKGLDFLLNTSKGNDQTGIIDGLPNWSYDENAKRMVRNKDYRYYWNPNEINYE